MSRNNWVKSLGLDKDGTLFVEVDNGIRLFDLCLDTCLPEAMTVSPEDLMRTENRRLYYRFLSTLNEIDGIVFHSLYDKDCRLKRGDVVVDAGARVGTFTAKISAAVGDEGRIIAVEPEPYRKCSGAVRSNWTFIYRCTSRHTVLIVMHSTTQPGIRSGLRRTPWTTSWRLWGFMRWISSKWMLKAPRSKRSKA